MRSACRARLGRARRRDPAASRRSGHRGRWRGFRAVRRIRVGAPRLVVVHLREAHVPAALEPRRRHPLGSSVVSCDSSGTHQSGLCRRLHVRQVEAGARRRRKRCGAPACASSTALGVAGADHRPPPGLYRLADLRGQPRPHRQQHAAATACGGERRRQRRKRAAARHRHVRPLRAAAVCPLPGTKRLAGLSLFGSGYRPGKRRVLPVHRRRTDRPGGLRGCARRGAAGRSRGRVARRRTDRSRSRRRARTVASGRRTGAL